MCGKRNAYDRRDGSRRPFAGSRGRGCSVQTEIKRRRLLDPRARVLGAKLNGGNADLRNAGKDTSEVLTYGMSYNQQRFSTLSQINRQTVRRLVPAWSYSMASNYGEESQPLIKDGVIYITGHDKQDCGDVVDDPAPKSWRQHRP
jgi:hypothetical protein